MEIIKNIAAIVGCILSLITLLTICSKAGRSVIKNIFQRHTSDLVDENKQQTEDIKCIKGQLSQVLIKMDNLEELSKQQCRDTIKEIYYKYNTTKVIPLYERKTADKTYSIYTDVFNGNSYATLLYGEICKWEIDGSLGHELDI